VVIAAAVWVSAPPPSFGEEDDDDDDDTGGGVGVSGGLCITLAVVEFVVRLRIDIWFSLLDTVLA